MNKRYLAELQDFYYQELTGNILPFWLAYARDKTAGGYHTCLDRDGSVYEYDKVCMWSAGRIIWTYAHMYNELEKDAEYLDMAKWGVDFTEENGFMPDGSMYYGLTREGSPLAAKQDIYTELSTVLGYTEYARATGDEHWYMRAREIFLQVWDSLQNPGQAFQGVLPEGCNVRLHGHSMITMNVLQELRRYRQESAWDEYIEFCIDNILNKHQKKEKRAVFELVGWEGNELPGSMGRWINPGHVIEGGIFLIHEGRRRKDNALISNGLDFIRWGFEWGWDKEYGGVFNDVDSQGLPFPTGSATTADSKLWWQHAEALYGLLLAYVESGDESFLRSYKAVHAYSFSRFADPVFGEWYGTLDRRGNHIGYAKGTARKNSFHIARNFLNIYKLLRGVL